MQHQQEMTTEVESNEEIVALFWQQDEMRHLKGREECRKEGSNMCFHDMVGM